ncbi:hypothetical protein SAMN05443144_103117 [Fodinibius roseus]|uniref:Uncharacterized protein n=1 Tax=Fodinibius roseus TaxID=1194090 RepID=A0A1M4W439_9BACT|nr:hypothetical protein [Fodinibius roseus]SHE76064.1 hypothetical protein SAMN05443144_103117 [Fodinibius roseus]
MILAILLALSAWMLSFILPWWSLAIPALLLGMWMGKTGWNSFGYGFLGIGGLWLLQTAYIHFANDGILTMRIAELFSLPYPFLVITGTVVAGGMAGGLSTLTGYFFKKVFFNRNI